MGIIVKCPECGTEFNELLYSQCPECGSIKYKDIKEKDEPYKVETENEASEETTIPHISPDSPFGYPYTYLFLQDAVFKGKELSIGRLILSCLIEMIAGGAYYRSRLHLKSI